MIRAVAVIKIVLVTLFLSTLSVHAREPDETEKLIETLTNLPGASGFEEPVRKAIIDSWKDNHVSITVDNIGNVIAEVDESQKNQQEKTNKQSKKSVLIMAHMDEVGFIITNIDERGFIKAKALGGWIDHVLWGHRWNITVGDKTISAITGMDAPHVLTDFSTPPAVDASRLFFDTGLSRQQLLEQGVRPGLPVTPAVRFEVLDPGKRYTAKALDDRALLAMMTELLREVKKNPQYYQHIRLIFAATVQEEVGMRGAAALASQVKPDIILNLEAGIAKDYPAQFTTETEPALGKGAALFIYDGSMLPDTGLVQFIHDVARHNNIPSQWESEKNYGQDASSLQFSRQGVKAINLALPVRYAHSHWGIMDRQDYDSMLRLLRTTLRELDNHQS